MCRWFAYISEFEPCLLEDVLLEPDHCIAKQVHEHYLPQLTAHSPDIREDAKEAERVAKENEIRNLLFNADGFGVGWCVTYQTLGHTHVSRS
jgi:glutamine amidotransferase